MNIERDIFPKRQSTSIASPQFAAPTINQTGSIITSTGFVAGTDFTIPAGAAAASVTIQLPVAPILGNNGRTGYFGNSSLVLTGAIATTLATEVAFVANAANTGGDVSGLSNGQFMVDYEAGIIYGKRVDNATTGTATYKYWKNSVAATLASGVTIDIGNVQTLAADSTTSGTVSATNAAGGTQIVAANTVRFYTEFTNTGSVDAYYGAGTVTSSFLPIVAGATKAWNSKEALKVLSSGAATNIAFCDYSNS